MGPFNNQPYDFNSPAVQNAFGGPNATIANPNAGNPNSFQWDKVMALNNAYKQQFGTNITDAALFRAYNEAQGNYLWGPPSSGSAPAGSTVADPTNKIVTDNGTYQGGTYTPNNPSANNPVIPNMVVSAPDISQIDPNNTVARTLPNGQAAPTSSQPGGLSQAIANTTNFLNTLPSTNSTVPTSTATGNTGGTGSNNSFGASDALLQQLQNATSNTQNPYDLLTSREQALGVPQAQGQVSALRQAITNTTNLLNQIAPSVQGNVANSLVTAAQANQMIQNQSAPIQANLATLGQQSSDAQSAYQNLLSQAMNEANLQSQGQQTNISNLQNLFGDISSSEQAKNAAATQQQQIAMQQQQMVIQQQQFAQQQATAQQQFEAQLALDTRKENLSEQQVADQRQQFALTQAEQQRQFDVQQAAAAQQAQVQQAQFNADLQQKQDQFNASLSAQQATAAKTAATPTMQDNWATAYNAIASASGIGSDGYANPTVYNAVKASWVQQGGSATEFDSHFKNLRNPNQANHPNWAQYK